MLSPPCQNMGEIHHPNPPGIYALGAQAPCPPPHGHAPGNLVILLCYLVLLQMYVIFISYAYLSIFHTNLYVNLFNHISFSTFINFVLQPECIILKFNSCLLSKISSRSP